MTAGNETLQRRGGANEPDRSRGLSIVDNIRGRNKAVPINGRDEVDLIPPPLPSNKGRATVIKGDEEVPLLGTAGCEQGSSLDGQVLFIDANGDEYELNAPTIGYNQMENIEQDSFASGLLPVLLHNERLVWRPAPGGSANDQGIFIPFYYDVDAIGFRVPIPASGEVTILEGVPGKLIGFPSAKGATEGYGPIMLMLGPSASSVQFYAELFFEDVEGNRVRVNTAAIAGDPTEARIQPFELDGVLTLGPGEKLIVKVASPPVSGTLDTRLTAAFTIALINAANESR